jgi:hypothetical protein
MTRSRVLSTLEKLVEVEVERVFLILLLLGDRGLLVLSSFIKILFDDLHRGKLNSR